MIKRIHAKLPPIPLIVTRLLFMQFQKTKKTRAKAGSKRY